MIMKGILMGLMAAAVVGTALAVNDTCVSL
jgi:hypothetical protein